MARGRGCGLGARAGWTSRTGSPAASARLGDAVVGRRSHGASTPSTTAATRRPGRARRRRPGAAGRSRRPPARGGRPPVGGLLVAEGPQRGRRPGLGGRRGGVLPARPGDGRPRSTGSPARRGRPVDERPARRRAGGPTSAIVGRSSGRTRACCSSTGVSAPARRGGSTSPGGDPVQQRHRVLVRRRTAGAPRARCRASSRGRTRPRPGSPPPPGPPRGRGRRACRSRGRSTSATRRPWRGRCRSR